MGLQWLVLGTCTEPALQLDFGYLSQKMSTPFKRWLERSRKRWAGGGGTHLLPDSDTSSQKPSLITPTYTEFTKSPSALYLNLLAHIMVIINV